MCSVFRFVSYARNHEQRILILAFPLSLFFSKVFLIIRQDFQKHLEKQFVEHLHSTPTINEAVKQLLVRESFLLDVMQKHRLISILHKFKYIFLLFYFDES